jgi:hypothetical protein
MSYSKRESKEGEREREEGVKGGREEERDGERKGYDMQAFLVPKLMLHRQNGRREM